MRIAPPAFSTFGCEKSLKIIGEIVKQLSAGSVKDLRADRDLHNNVCSIFTVAIRSLAMSSSLGVMLGIKSKMQKRV
jgi:hypothetical protein